MVHTLVHTAHRMSFLGEVFGQVIVCTILDYRSSRDRPLGDAIETFILREDAERFVEEVRHDLC